MSTSLEAGLKALKNLQQYYDDIYNQDFSDINEREQYDIIEKAIKENQDKVVALEIIKKKGLSLIHKSLIISSRNYEEYRQEFQLAKSRIFKDDYFYEKEEFDLLKEALKNASL